MQIVKASPKGLELRTCFIYQGIVKRCGSNRVSKRESGWMKRLIESLQYFNMMGK